MRVADFDFDLPETLIAQHPARPRDSARLLRIEPDRLVDDWIAHLAKLLNPGDLLIFNNTRVLPARLAARRGEAAVDITLHQQTNDDVWRAFARPARKCRIGDVLTFAGPLHAEVIERGEHGEIALRFSLGGKDLIGQIRCHGRMPLPPYIKRQGPSGAADDRDYQTLFAEKDGAVAAPTASLHFTPDLMDALERSDIRRAFITLHVGAGTFLPVRSDDTDDHRMHAEQFEVGSSTVAAVEATRARGGRVIAVGTTVLRTLEAAADVDGRLQAGIGETRLFITPGYRFRVVDGLLTNFHLPRSTLFMLVAAFSGLERMRGAYDHAIREGYRFFSYGDACLLSPAHPEAR